MNQKCTLCNHEAVFFKDAHSRQFFRCEQCDLIFLLPEQRLNTAQEFERYNLHQNDSNDENYRLFLNQLAEPMIQNLTAGVKGLDYGSGPGPTLSKIFEEQGFKMALYDPYFAANENVLKQSYDFVTCCETAEHFFNPKKQFDLLNQVLRCDGWLGVMTQILKEGEMFEDWYYAKDPTHVSFYSHKTMQWLAQRYGWKVLIPRENVILFQKAGIA